MWSLYVQCSFAHKHIISSKPDLRPIKWLQSLLLERSIQKQKGDSLAADHESILSEFTHVHLTQKNLQELKEAWDQLGMDMKQKFQSMYGDITYLLNVEVDLGLIRALTQFWSPSYSCFTFNQLDMTPTIEEYTALLHLKGVKLDQVYTKAHKPDPLVEKLMNLVGMGKAWVGKQKHKRGNSEGLDLADFSYKVEFWVQVKNIQKAWTQPQRVETEKARPMFTIDYEAWRTRRGFDNIPLPDQKNVLSFEEHLKVVPTEVEVMHHECEVEKNELKRRIRKLKVDGMRKTTEDWECELREQEMEAGRYKKLFLEKEKDFRSLSQDMQRLQQRSNSTWDDLVKSQGENQELKDVVSELEESLQNQYQSASKKLKLIIDIRAAVKVDRDHWNLTLTITRGEVKKREDLMTNVRSQDQKVAEKIVDLANEAEILKLKVGCTSHYGKELTRFLDEIEKLGVRAGLYLDSFALI
ncbi:hypothetical protein GQ457_13G018660 [Hibiscus cannabinus]